MEKGDLPNIDTVRPHGIPSQAPVATVIIKQFRTEGGGGERGKNEMVYGVYVCSVNCLKCPPTVNRSPCLSCRELYVYYCIDRRKNISRHLVCSKKQGNKGKSAHVACPHLYLLGGDCGELFKAMLLPLRFLDRIRDVSLSWRVSSGEAIAE